MLGASISGRRGIVRARTGLLKWNVGGSGTREFQAGEWDVHGQSADGFGVGAYGIAYTGPLVNLHNVLRCVALPDLDTMLVQGNVYGTTANGPVRSVGVAARAQPTGNSGTSVVTYVGHRLPVGIANGVHGVSEFDGDVETAFQGDVQTLPLDVGQRSSVYCNKQIIAAYHHGLALGYQANVAFAGVGKPGISFWDDPGAGPGQVICAEFVACRDRYVRLFGAGLSNGFVCKVRTAADLVIAQAVASGQVALIDVFGKLIDGTWANVAVFNSLGQFLGAFAPGGDGVLPGDEYQVGLLP